MHPTSPGGQNANDHRNTTIPKDIHPPKTNGWYPKIHGFCRYIFRFQGGLFQLPCFLFLGCKTLPCPPKISPFSVGIPELSSPNIDSEACLGRCSKSVFKYIPAGKDRWPSPLPSVLVYHGPFLFAMFLGECAHLLSLRGEIRNWKNWQLFHLKKSAFS